MSEEFDLSEKELSLFGTPIKYYLEEDVKEFIRRLKEEIRKTSNRDDKVKATLLFTDMGGIGKNELNEIIDKLAGDKLK